MSNTTSVIQDISNHQKFPRLKMCILVILYETGEFILKANRNGALKLEIISSKI